VNIMPEFGTVRENEAAFEVAVSSLTRGDITWGRSILAALRDHIGSTEEQKSAQGMLPQVRKTLAALKTCTPTPTAHGREEGAGSHRAFDPHGGVRALGVPWMLA